MNEIVNALEKISNAIINNSSQALWPIIIPIGISMLSLVFSFIAFTFERRLLKQNRFDEIQKQYRSKEMFDNLNLIYENWELTKKELKEGKIQQEALIGKTILGIPTADRMHKQKAILEKEISVSNEEIANKMVTIKDINRSRRYVSHFFAMFAKYSLDNKLNKKDIRSFWSADNLSIIHEMIIPLEKEYAKLKYGYDESRLAKNKTLLNLELFYNKFK